MGLPIKKSAHFEAGAAEIGAGVFRVSSPKPDVAMW
jgi:hypothetical protein